MSLPAKTIYYFGFYIGVLGLTLLLGPGLLAELLGFQAESYIWLRMIGMFMLFLAFYYYQTARQNITGFFYLTVYTRASIPVFMIVFYILGMVKPIFIALSLVDFCCAMLTWSALRRTGSKSPVS
ncbi:hypothetical protein WMW72_22490 [Paenibacillus filicis]|uniref:EamA domain-containing protein n=1 Tax=Paenibacillus filicis TaxID=669464 RepID=A0ABU9DRH5_9BACL